MRLFHCDHCENLIYFENHTCVSCSHKLAFLPDARIVASLDPAGNDLWQSPAPSSQGRTYRLCANYTQHETCNWAIPSDQTDALCSACQLTRVIPDLTMSGHREAWYKLEAAKRRLVYGLTQLKLPVFPKTAETPHGLEFAFLAATLENPVLTGHDNGIITISLAEADDAERERRRNSMHEPYRTLLGHMRHESGHYYWDLLIRDHPERLAACRALFGDDSLDYGEALKTHYANGAPANWQTNFISAYASAHAWEDWAETWAHYLHITDAVETAEQCGVSLARPLGSSTAALAGKKKSAPPADSFDAMIARWFDLTHAINNLNRGLGLPDSYPFVLSIPVIEKLRFIHTTVAAGIIAPPAPSAPIAPPAPPIA